MGQDYGTIRLPREEFDKHNERRKDVGLTWVEYMNGESPDYSKAVDFDELEDRIVVRFAREVEADVSDVQRRIDDLEANLPRKVAEELRWLSLPNPASLTVLLKYFN